MASRCNSARLRISSVYLASGVLVLVAAAAAADMAMEDVGPRRDMAPPPAFGSCDPITPELCMLPFPNNFFLRPQAATGLMRVALANDTLPLDFSGHGVSTTAWDALDGFPVVPSIMTYLPNATIDSAGAGYTLPRLWNISASLDDDSATVLLRADTGERVAHWVELDHFSDTASPGGYPRIFFMWPAAALEFSTRYIVAIRGIVNASGGRVAPSDAFHDLRDNVTSPDWNVEGRRALFEDIFERLGAAGVPRASLQVAWDFDTASVEGVTGRMLSMRDDALARYADAPIGYEVDLVTDDFSPAIARRVQGHMMVPWYLNEPSASLDSRIVVDENGDAVYQGVQPVNFTVLIPRSLAAAGGKLGRILQYGHGLFGDQSEVTEEYLDDEANAHGYVLCAVDWLGLSSADQVNVGLMITTDLSNFPIIPDRCSQGMLNALSMMELMLTGLAADPAMAYNGTSVVDTSRRSYTGNSCGGVLGTVYMALTTRVERGVIGVGGGPFGILLPRSVDFNPLADILRLRYPPFALPALLGAFQMLWDRLEPAGYVRAVSVAPLPNTPAHRVVFQYGLGDAQVSWLGTEILARSTRAVMFESNVREGNESWYGFGVIPDTAVETVANVMVGWDYGAPVAPFVNVSPGAATDAHEKVRRTVTAQDMMYRFLETGEVVNTCGGPCRNVSRA